MNNAGTAIPKAFEETTLEEMDRVLDINVRGVFAATHAALKHMNEYSLSNDCEIRRPTAKTNSCSIYDPRTVTIPY